MPTIDSTNSTSGQSTDITGVTVSNIVVQYAPIMEPLRIDAQIIDPRERLRLSADDPYIRSFRDAWRNWRGSSTRTFVSRYSLDPAILTPAPPDACHICEHALTEETRCTVNSRSYCLVCHDETFALCSSCENFCPRHDSRTVRGARYCQGCYRQCFALCVQCGEEHPHTEMNSVSGGGACDSCYEDFLECTECNQMCHCDQISDESGEYVCTRCTRSRPNSIREYSYRPRPEFMRANSETVNPPYYFGLELEVEACHSLNRPETVAKTISGLIPWVYCKHDGSISNGFEIVSHPLSWRFLREKKKLIEDNMLRYLTDIGYRSYEPKTCGLHVHVSRKGFSGLHLYKLQKLVYDNPDYMLRLSRRSKASLMQWANLYDGVPMAKIAKGDNCGLARYMGINCQNTSTIEFRFFRGTLAPCGFWRVLEFVRSAVEYTRTAGIKQVTLPHYFDYIDKNQKEYKNLYDFVRRHPAESEAVCV